MSDPQKPVVLCVMDGWGWREAEEMNAVRLARTPVFDRLWQSCPHAFLDASGEDVGLPHGQIGNSEVGHMNLGAGRIVLQDLLKIDRAAAEGSLAEAEALQQHIAKLKASGGTCHVMGLCSPGGVHSQDTHMAALARLVAAAGVPVALHLFTDGRDVPPRDALRSVGAFLGSLADVDGWRVATVVGRYYAMDRDKRWERVERAYRAVIDGQGETAADALAAIRASYDADAGDEFIAPTVVGDYAGMADGDGVLFINFRADRARQLLNALLDPAFDGFARRTPALADACGMVEYSEQLNRYLSAIFPPKSLTRVLGEVVADAGRAQLRMAETEKYPHVTFFLNGGEEKQFPGEDRIMVPSPKVATYDLQPEMSAPEVTRRLVEAVDSGRYDLIVINFANPDMVGHTGDLDAAIKAVETVDDGVGQLAAALERQGGVMILTADHGNCEMMWDPETNGPHTAHTTNPVPVLLVNARDAARLRNGRLSDVAPTLLQLMGIPQPAEMSGRPLIEDRNPRAAAE